MFRRFSSEGLYRPGFERLGGVVDLINSSLCLLHGSLVVAFRMEQVEEEEKEEEEREVFLHCFRHLEACVGGRCRRVDTVVGRVAEEEVALFMVLGEGSRVEVFEGGVSSRPPCSSSSPTLGVLEGELRQVFILGSALLTMFGLAFSALTLLRVRGGQALLVGEEGGEEE